MEKIVSLCKRRGFIFQASEIYGGLNGVWDYGPLGVELKRNLKDYWWRVMVRERDDVVGMDGAILTHRAVSRRAGTRIRSAIRWWIAAIASGAFARIRSVRRHRFLPSSMSFLIQKEAHQARRRSQQGANLKRTLSGKRRCRFGLRVAPGLISRGCRSPQLRLMPENSMPLLRGGAFLRPVRST